MLKPKSFKWINISALFLLFALAFAISFFYRQHSESEIWSDASPLERKRSEASALVYRGDIFVFNGFGEQIKIENSVERYNRRTGKWKTISETSVKEGTALTRPLKVQLKDHRVDLPNN